MKHVMKIVATIETVITVGRNINIRFVSTSEIRGIFVVAFNEIRNYCDAAVNKEIWDATVVAVSEIQDTGDVRAFENRENGVAALS